MRRHGPGPRSEDGRPLRHRRTSRVGPDEVGRGHEWRRLAWPGLVAVALAAAVVLVPFPLVALVGGGYADRSALTAALGDGLVRFASGTGAPGPDVAAAVDFWARFHAVKALLAAAFLLAVARLAGRSGQVGEHARGGRSRYLVGGWFALLATTAAVGLLVLVANLQGALVPLTSALGLLPVAAPDPALAATLESIGAELTSGRPSAPVTTLLRDFTAYHQVMAWLAAVTAVVLAFVAVLAWRRAGVAGGRGPAVGVASAALTVVFVVVASANAATAADPVPAMLAFLAGGL